MTSRRKKEKEESKLYDWLNRQRDRYRLGKLDKYKVDKLTLLKYFVLDSAKRENRRDFNSRIEDLKLFIENNGRLPKKQRSKDQDERSLAGFIKNNRISYKKNKLSEERIQMFNSIKLWTWDAQLDSFNNQYNKLISFIDKNGRLPTQGSKDLDEHSLAIFIKHNRKNHKKNH